MTYTLSHTKTEYFRLSDGYYKAVCIGRDRIKIVWIKENFDDDDNPVYSIWQWTVNPEHFQQNFTPDMICDKVLYEFLANSIKELL